MTHPEAMRAFRPIRTPSPITTCGPMAIGSSHRAPRPTRAVGSMPGVHTGCGYSTGRTAMSAACGSLTTMRAAAGPGVVSNGGATRTTDALVC